MGGRLAGRGFRWAGRVFLIEPNRGATLGVGLAVLLGAVSFVRSLILSLRARSVLDRGQPDFRMEAP
jgi:uncharacterized membrane protein (DUF485 family)